MEQVLIGRRSVNYPVFVDAVKTSSSVTDVCDKLGFNNTVATTRKAIKEQIQSLHLDVSHFNKPLIDTSNFQKAAEERIKAFSLSSDNQKYFDAFQTSVSEGSWWTYKATIGNFLEQLADRDFATITEQDITNYADGRKNAESHLRSLMTYIVSNDINNAKQKVSKDMLIWLISSRVKK